MLLKVSNPEARAFYEIEAAREAWSSVELERQVGALLFERLAKSKDKKKVRALSHHGQHVETPGDVIKEPFVLEFLGLDERAEWRERNLEQAIIRSGSRSTATTSSSTSSSTTGCCTAPSWSTSSSAS